jgi:hypothetical protein
MINYFSVIASDQRSNLVVVALIAGNDCFNPEV